MLCSNLQSLLAKQPAVTAGRPVVSGPFYLFIFFLPSFGSHDNRKLPPVSLCMKLGFFFSFLPNIGHHKQGTHGLSEDE